MSDNSELRTIVREEVTAAVAPLEKRVEQVETRTKYIIDRVEEQATIQTEQAKTQTKLAEAVAEATALAGRAIRENAETKDATEKMLKSAFEGHKKAVSETITTELAAGRQDLVASIERTTNTVVTAKVAAAVKPINERTQNIARELGVPDDERSGPYAGEAKTPGALVKGGHRVTVTLVLSTICALGMIAKLLLDWFSK